MRSGPGLFQLGSFLRASVKSAKFSCEKSIGTYFWSIVFIHEASLLKYLGALHNPPQNCRVSSLGEGANTVD